MDTLLGQTTLGNSGSANEENWIESVLLMDIDYTQLDDSSSEGDNWEAVVGGAAGDYAFQFTASDEPEYFLVKTGNGSGNGVDDSHYLFQNNGSLNWAFVNLSIFGEAVSITNIDVISHVGQTGSGSGGGGSDDTPVPEPGSIALLGLGLIGLTMARRKQFK
jgi:hypothetical protein